MKDVKWRQHEIVAYLEELIVNDEASDDEIEMYEEMVWNNTYKLNKKKYFNTYVMIVQEMNDTYNN